MFPRRMVAALRLFPRDRGLHAVRGILCRSLFVGLFCLAVVNLSPRAALATDDQGPGLGPWAHTREADVRLIAATTALNGQTSLRAGLDFRLKDAWKVYWRSPGDAGYPPSVDWQGSENLGAVETAWPVPHRFELFGIQTAGYKERVVFPLTLAVTDPSQPLRLRGEVDYLICADICVPGHAQVTLDLDAQGDTRPSTAVHLIDQFQARVPSLQTGITLEQSALEQTSSGSVLAVAVSATPPLGTELDLFVEGEREGLGRGILSGKPQITRSADGQSAVFRVPIFDGYHPGQPVSITVADGARGLETSLVPSTAPLQTTLAAPGPAIDPTTALWGMLGLAVAGGLILNLMPCVLPVLSLKVLALISHGGRARQAARYAFVASAAGIICTFLVLAGILIALRTAGVAIGWGIQFQQPIFLILMIALLLGFAANMWGLFEIRLPGFISDVATHDQGHHHGWLGHFLTGALATILATPCSAPLLGTAVGFALASDGPTIVMIFAALGLGMAAPYLLIAAVPALATCLPRPGHWMLTLKKILAIALLGTALWLASVLGGQVGWMPSARSGPNTTDPTSVTWTSFIPQGSPPPQEVRQAITQGKVVVVDVTADWCITCKVNKAAVLDRDPVAATLTQDSVLALRADWTRPNEDIAAYLAAYGRYGIPFNIIYGPKAPQGIPLSELLSTDEVLSALKQAGLP